MAAGHVEKEAGTVADYHVKHVTSEVHVEAGLEGLLGLVQVVCLTARYGSYQSGEVAAVNGGAETPKKGLKDGTDCINAVDTSSMSGSEHPYDVTELLAQVRRTVVSRGNVGVFNRLAVECVTCLVRHVSEPAVFLATIPGSIKTHDSSHGDNKSLTDDCYVSQELNYSQNDASNKGPLSPQDASFTGDPSQHHASFTGPHEAKHPSTKDASQTTAFSSDNVVSEGSPPVSSLEAVFELLLILLYKKGVVIPVIDILTCISNRLGEEDSSGVRRFEDVCLKLIHIGVMTPARLEHWLIWLLDSNEGVCRESVINISTNIIARYEEMKDHVRNRRMRSVPGVACFLRQYIVNDFECLKNQVLQ